MKSIDNEGLKLITSIITDNISTSSIYCFGEKKNVQTIGNPFKESVASKSKRVHFYLMVLTDEYIINAVADISDIVKTKTEGKYIVTLILYKVNHGQYLSRNQRYFYSQVLNKGYKVYEREDMPLNIPFEQVPCRSSESISIYWNNRKTIAHAYIQGQNQIDYTDTLFVQESMLHIAVEQICLGLINVFLGYYPDHFALPYLFDLCEVFSSLTSDMFPQATGEDKRLFDVLKANQHSLRWANTKKTSIADIQILERRCGLFYEKACQIAEAELKLIDNKI